MARLLVHFTWGRSLRIRSLTFFSRPLRSPGVLTASGESCQHDVGTHLGSSPLAVDKPCAQRPREASAHWGFGRRVNQRDVIVDSPFQSKPACRASSHQESLEIAYSDFVALEKSE